MNAALGIIAVLLLGAPPSKADPFSYQLQDHALWQGLDPHYFTGLLLTEHDLDQDQSYFAAASQFIGAPQQDLASLFSASPSANAILLFDEADALFGQRTDVKDAHDRYGQDFIALNPRTGLWLGQLFVGGVQGVTDGVYDLSGTFSDNNGTLNLVAVAAPEPTAIFVPGLLMLGALVSRIGRGDRFRAQGSIVPRLVRPQLG